MIYLVICSFIRNFAAAFRVTSVRRPKNINNIIKIKKKKANDYCTRKRRREHREGPQEV